MIYIITSTNEDYIKKVMLYINKEKEQLTTIVLHSWIPLPGGEETLTLFKIEIFDSFPTPFKQPSMRNSPEVSANTHKIG